MAKAYVFFAEGYEEIEALTVVDLLRRANVSAVMVSMTGKKQVKGAHGITVEMDALYEEVEVSGADALVLPGGMPGTRNLEAHAPLVEEIKRAADNGKLVCAICAAPLVLGVNRLLEGKNACCYPGFEKDLLGATVSYDKVVQDGNIITSRGLGTAIEFAGEIIANLVDRKTAEDVKTSIIY